MKLQVLFILEHSFRSQPTRPKNLPSLVLDQSILYWEVSCMLELSLSLHLMIRLVARTFITMSGFKFNLNKSKVTKPIAAKPKSSLLAKVAAGKSKLAPVKQNILYTGDDDDDHQKITIDGFDSTKGALKGDEAVSEKEKIVITPSCLSVKLLRPTKMGDKTDNHVADGDATSDRARVSLIRGESALETSSFSIQMGAHQEAEESTEKDYEDVPVEQFGMALLRGMGWKEENTVKESSSVLSRQRGLTLGIGAKAVDKEMEQELMGLKGAKLTVPILPKGRK